MRIIGVATAVLAFLLFLPEALQAVEKVFLTGQDLMAWQGNPEWSMAEDAFLHPTNDRMLSIKPGAGVIVGGHRPGSPPLVSKQRFGDIRAHIEFVIPKGSSSGIFFQGRYELQIYDSYGQDKGAYPGVECGGIYQRWDESRMPKGYEGRSPKVNASRPPGQWQTFDVIFKAPRFDEYGRKVANASFVKVVHNGTVIHENVELGGMTRGSTYTGEEPVGPLLLQGDHGPVAYRNIWIIPIDGEKMGFTNPFFAMDTGTIDEKHRTAKEQVEMLRELGYAGIGYWERNPSRGPRGLADTIVECDRAGLKAFPVYFTIKFDDANDRSLPLIEESIKLLARRDATIWVAITSDVYSKSSAAGDNKAVEVVSRIADAAQQSAVKIALYPHVSFWLEKVDDAVRLAEKCNRRNVGVTFNLYHWLKTDKPENMESVLKKAMPYLFVVTINGSSNEGSIETLDRGPFDVYKFLKTLKSLGFTGPIGLQGYGVSGDVYDNLKRSMSAWRRFCEQATMEEVESL
jgi:sugar phosphate isomerase/epimerase